MHKGSAIRLSAGFPYALEDRRQWADIFKVVKEKKKKTKTVTRILYPAKLFFGSKGEIKTYPNKQKLREFITILKEILKEVLQ